MDIKALTDEVEHISRAYASRFEINRDDTWFLLKLHGRGRRADPGSPHAHWSGPPKGITAEEIDDAFRSEVADVLAHTLLLSRHHRIHVEAEIERKWLVWREAAPRPEDALAHER